MRLGILHPGAMGAALGANANAEVVWAGEGRSEATADRARGAGMTDVGSLANLVASVEMIISICPPSAALEVADEVRTLGYGGLYVDANAVAPSTTRQIANGFARFVDGGVVGGPPAPPNADEPSRTRLYLSGPRADRVAGLFDGTNVDARIIGDDPGSASALKMAFAGWTKGSSALLLSLAAYARRTGVIDYLMGEWEESIPELPDRLRDVTSRVGRKAWRFEGEMVEIATALREAGLADGFHLAAAEVFGRLAPLRDENRANVMAEVLDLIQGRD